jgi:hypothetical protein
MHLLRIFQSEWLKRRRSLASWLVIIGGLFTPVIIFTIRMIYHERLKLPEMFQSPDFWQASWSQAWESMALFMLPMGIIMATGLMTQLEYKNNTWKQLHTTPQRMATIFCMKLLIILIMLAQVFVVFNAGLYFFGILPSLFLSSVSYPASTLPWTMLLQWNLNFFLDCLPLVGLQYALGLHFKNFLVPFGIGFLLWVVSMSGLTWEYNYILPYSYTMLDYLVLAGRKVHIGTDIHVVSLVYFAIFIVGGYAVYVWKNEKG